MSARLLKFPIDETLRDVPGKLRRLADDVERGAYGTVLGCAVVLDADGIELFGFGEGVTSANDAWALFNLGAAKFARTVLEEKG